MSDPATPPAPRRRRRWPLWAGGALVLLAALVAAAPAIVSTSWANDRIRAWIDENLDREVTFSSLEVGWSDGVKLRGLVVQDEYAGRPPVLEAPVVVLRAPVLPMLAQRFDVEEFVIEDATVRVVQRDDGVNAAGVLKRRKPKKASAKKDADADEPLVLPDIRVPVTVKNLTLVIVDREGREARRPGIAFRGRLDTREGPTTFDLDVPTGADGRLRVEGRATLFDPEGRLLAGDAVAVDADVAATRVDAKQNADLLALFLPAAPTSGVLDAKVSAHYGEGAARGSVDVQVRGLATRTAAASPTAGDLDLKGRWEFAGRKVRVQGMQVRAEGLRVDADLGGDWPVLDGRLTLDADLARVTDALRGFGMAVDATVAGTARGEVTFAPSPAGGRGTIALTGFRVESRTGAHAPVVVQKAEIAFAGVPQGDAFRLDALDVRLADVTAHAEGTIGGDGALDVRATAQGDLGGLLDRVRDLGMLPSGLSVRGTLDAAVAVKGRAGATSVTIDRLVLAEEDVRIEAKGTATPTAIDLVASGSGDLGKLLGRAQAAGAKGPGLDAVRGRFTFEASAAGPPDALVVRLPKFRLDGDFAVDASGEYRANGAVDAKLHAEGRIADAIALARKVGALDRDVRLDGTLRVDAVVAGTAQEPQVPTLAVVVDSPVMKLDVKGAVDAQRRLTGEARGDGALADLCRFAHEAGFLEKPLAPQGRLAFRAAFAGSKDAVEVPSAEVRVTGPIEMTATGSLDAAGKIAGDANGSAAIAELCRAAHDAGFLEKPFAPAGRVAFRAQFAGTKDAFAVPSAEVRVTELVDLTATGSLDAARRLRAEGKFAGALQPLLDAASQWSGGQARRVDGSLSGSFTAEGPSDALAFAVPSLRVDAGGATLDASATRTASGDADAKLRVRGPIAGLLDVARAFDVANDLRADGVLDATVDGKLAARRATATAGATVTDLVLHSEKPGEEPFRERRVALTTSGIDYDLDAGRFAPLQVKLDCEGAAVAATLATDGGPARADGTRPRIVRLTGGTLRLDRTFAANHAASMGGTTFDLVEGPFTFDGDVSQGRAGAAGWAGGAELTVKNLVAPHVRLDAARAVAKLEGGALVVDPIEGTVNGGPVAGTARVGLVGDRPEHSLDLTGKDVRIEEDVAPLVARASPLFAVGESGKAGGRAGVDVHLRARGLESAEIKRTLTGKGTLNLQDAFVESGDWVGVVLQLVGGSGRLDIAPVDVPFEVSDGRVRTGSVGMDGVGLLMRLAGEVGLEGDLDYTVRVRPKRESGTFSKYATLLDPEGFLPLRLGGSVKKPKLKLPDLKDVLKSKAEDLLGGLLGGGDDDEDKGKDKDKGQDEGKGGRQDRDGKDAEGDRGGRRRDPQPPEPKKPPRRKGPRGGDAPPETPPGERPPAEEPPPPPPPQGSGRGEDPAPPAPPPAPPEKEPEEEPPPPPPPKSR